MKTLVVLVFFGRIPCVPQVVITSQEAPSTDKGLREELYKEVMSGDPVAARLPYAILTKMVTFSGWKVFEMNETLNFHGVTEMTFPSIVRRSFIINTKGRFAGAQRLSSLAPGTQAHFLTKDVKDFVTSQPAAGALFTVVFGELCDFLALRPSSKRLKGTLEGGGDGGLTSVTMRAACGLPAEDVALLPDGAGHGVALGQARAWCGGESVTWLAAGRGRGACPVPCVSREALPGERLGLLLGSTTSAGCTRTSGRGCRPGSVWDPVATEGERVVEGAAAERQVRGAVDPAHP